MLESCSHRARAGLFGALVLTAAAGVQGQEAVGTAAVAKEALLARRCGSLVVRSCPLARPEEPTTAAYGARRVAPRQFEEARQAIALDLGEILVSGERIRSPAASLVLAQRIGQGNGVGIVRAVFDRNLGTGDLRGRREFDTVDWGGGVRCTISSRGSEICTDPVNVTPGKVGP